MSLALVLGSLGGGGDPVAPVATVLAQGTRPEKLPAGFELGPGFVPDYFPQRKKVGAYASGMDKESALMAALMAQPQWENL